MSLDYDQIPLTITKTSTDGLAYNLATHRLGGSIAFPKGTKLGLQNCSIYYSWQNVSSVNNNNTISYIYNGVTYPITIPDGYYSISDYNAYIQFKMKSNGHYLLDSNGLEVYFISLTLNLTYYAFMIQCDVVPSVLGTYTNPAGMTLTGQTMSLVIPSTSTVYLLGFTAQTFPTTPQATQQQKLSDIVPQISPTVQAQVHSSLISNGFYSPNASDVLFTFTPDKPYGQILTLEPKNILYCGVHNMSFSQIDIRFTDQNGKDLNIIDWNWAMTLILLIPRQK